jgi:predicted amidohydrolase
VVEFAPKQAPTQQISWAEAHALNLANLQRFEPFVEQAKANGSQIIVFPEYGLTGDGVSDASGQFDFSRDGVENFTEPIPEPSPLVLCNSASSVTHPVSSAASCLAKKHAIVLVINFLDRIPCSPPTAGAGNSSGGGEGAGDALCPDGRHQFNTAVAFDESGAIIAKYHKRHLYGDEAKYLDAGTRPNGTAFQTSFGVEFGMFICFDIFWQTAPAHLHYAYPTEWVNNVIVPEKANEAQRAWTLEHQTNLLAANYGGFGRSASGSGIWAKGRALAKFYNPTADPQSKLLVADVPCA